VAVARLSNMHFMVNIERVVTYSIMRMVNKLLLAHSIAGLNVLLLYDMLLRLVEVSFL
jgi:hypothetical protein